MDSEESSKLVQNIQAFIHYHPTKSSRPQEVQDVVDAIMVVFGPEEKFRYSRSLIIMAFLDRQLRNANKAGWGCEGLALPSNLPREKRDRTAIDW
jgi:hypothetical protein